MPWNILEASSVLRYIVIGMPKGKDLREVREFYDNLSQEYDKLYGAEQSRKHDEIVRLLIGRMRRIVLDVGCGNGRLFSHLARFSKLQVGLDLSRCMLEQAKRSMIESVDLVQGEATNLPFRDDSIDCVTSVSLADNDTLTDITSEAVRVSVPDGLVVLSTIHPNATLAARGNCTGENVAYLPISERETLLIIQGNLGQVSRRVLKNE